jgi:S-formylglutathione hydrolase FrmB
VTTGLRFLHHVLPVESHVLRGNPLGDPHRRELHVLAPDGEHGPLPAIWLLAGYSGSPATMLADDPWSEGMLRRVQRLADRGDLPPALFALPDGFTALGGSQYLDSTATGAYETHLWTELRPALEARFPVRAHGVAGKSSGGYGAIVQAMRHPEIVRAVACHSGDMCFEYTYLPHFPALADALRRLGGVDGLIAAHAADPNKRGKLFDPIQTLCMAACYAPDPAAPSGIALPVDPQTGAVDEAVFARWLALDPVRMIREDRHAQALAGLELLFLDCGDRDEYQLHWGLRQLVAGLAARGVRHTHEEFEGGHGGISHRYDMSLPRLAHALARVG